MAGGQLCQFEDGQLAGMKALIEQNQSTQTGRFWPGIHVFTDAFREKERGFRLTLEDYEARAAR